MGVAWSGVGRHPTPTSPKGGKGAPVLGLSLRRDNLWAPREGGGGIRGGRGTDGHRHRRKVREALRPSVDRWAYVIRTCWLLVVGSGRSTHPSQFCGRRFE